MCSKKREQTLPLPLIHLISSVLSDTLISFSAKPLSVLITPFFCVQFHHFAKRDERSLREALVTGVSQIGCNAETVGHLCLPRTG